MELTDFMAIMERYDIKDLVELEALIKFAINMGEYLKNLGKTLDVMEMMLDEGCDKNVQ